MIQFRTGSHTQKLLTLLCVVGEFPYRSLDLLGNGDVYKKLVRRLCEKQIIRNTETGKMVYVKLLSVLGSGQYRTVRINREALPVLEWIGLSEYYTDNFCTRNFQSDISHVERNHRVAEAMAMFMNVGLDIRPNMLPPLEDKLTGRYFSEPTVYMAKIIKKHRTSELNKTAFTRIVSAVFTADECYAVYNTRKSVMKWSGMGEFKTKHLLIETARLNGSIDNVDSAILFGASGKTALDTLVESDKSRRLEYRFDRIYRHVHYFPLDRDGERQLRLFLIPRWKERLLQLLFEDGVRSYNNGHFEYDAYVNGVYVLSHFDGDIARLIRFREGIEHFEFENEIICFPHQAEYVRAYLGSRSRIKTIDLSTIEKAFEKMKGDR